MDLRELGVQLKERREALGLSLDEVIQRTKISRRNIVAIEEGNRDDLPHPVYSKGFIRNYAKLLSLDMDEVEKILTLEFAQKEESQAEVEEALDDLRRDIRLHADAARNKSRGKVGVSIFIGFLLVVLIGLAIWLLPSFLPVSQDISAGVSTSVPSEERTVSMSATKNAGADENLGSNVMGQLVEDNASLNSDRQALESFGANQTSDVLKAEEATSSVGAVKNEASVVSQVAEATEDSGAYGETGNVTSRSENMLSSVQTASDAGREKGVTDSNKVVVTAREKCWLAATSDSSTREVFLLPGNQVLFEFKDKLVLKLGNGGGVDVTFNGQPVSIGVSSGSVKTLIFP